MLKRFFLANLIWVAAKPDGLGPGLVISQMYRKAMVLAEGEIKQNKL